MSSPPPTNTTSTSVTPRVEKAIVHDTSRFQNLMDSARFEHIQRVGTMYANSNLVPDHFKGKQADCVIAVEMALRLDVHPFTLMQAMYVVHGKPGIEAKLAIALINQSGLFQGPLQFKLDGTGMGRKCIAFQAHAKTGQVCEAECTMEMAKAEGWYDKAGSKWKTIPDMMLRYRSASFFGRLYCPEVLFGMQTREELEEIDVTPAAEASEKPAKASFRQKAGVVVDADPVPPHTPGPVDDGTAREASTPEPTTKKRAAPKAKEPPVPFENVLEMAKRAANADQADVVADLIRDDSYTVEQQQEVAGVLAKVSA